MQNTLDFTAVFRFHRHNISVAPHGDNLLLQAFLVCGRGYDFVQYIADFARARGEVASDVGKLRACRIGNGVRINNALSNSFAQWFVSVESIKMLRKRLTFNIIGIFFESLCRFEHLAHRENLSARKRAAHVGALEAGAHIESALYGSRSFFCNKCYSLSRFCLKLIDFFDIVIYFRI